jgi:Tfp pilus assembly protein PilV
MTRLPRPRRRLDGAGVTLVELMIVLVVVAAGILVFSRVQTRSFVDVDSTGRRTRALAVAQTQMEVARGLGFRAAWSDSGTADGFKWLTVVDSADVGLDRITTTATWTDQGRPNSVQLISLVSQR